MLKFSAYRKMLKYLVQLLNPFISFSVVLFIDFHCFLDTRLILICLTSSLAANLQLNEEIKESGLIQVNNENVTTNWRNTSNWGGKTASNNISLEVPKPEDAKHSIVLESVLAKSQDKDLTVTEYVLQSKQQVSNKSEILQVKRTDELAGNISEAFETRMKLEVELADQAESLIDNNEKKQLDDSVIRDANTGYGASLQIENGQIDGVTELPKEEDIIEAANLGLEAMNDLYYIKEPDLYIKGLFLDEDNPARYVAAFNEQTEEARKLARFGYASIEAAKAFKRKFPDISRQGSFLPITQGSDLHRQCPKRGIPQCKTASLRYRTADGSCNNPKHLWWGSSMSAFSRFLPAVYQDGIESVRLSITGAPLPSARDVSNFIHEDRDIPSNSITHMLMQWGQFVDHDITATGQSRGFNGTVPQCCLRGGSGFQPPELMHPECLPIAISSGDTFFRHFGVRCLEFIRSTLAPREGCEFGFREQINQVTSFLDASTVYSSNARQSDSLRLKRNGLLQYGRVQARMPVLPRDNSDLCRQGTLSTSCFKAGDGRLSEQPALTSLHIIFLRLHNRIATQLNALNQHWNDEKLYQETRKIVGAIAQQITYHEFLPLILGPDVMKIFDLEIKDNGYYGGYDPDVNPDVANEFSAAAYRFGHSLVQNSFVRFDKGHVPLFNNVSIHEEFTQRANLQAGALDRIILGLINQPAQRRDEFIVGELTNHLFQTPRFPFGMDLASLNIQRGRDHGIAPYVQWRIPCELSPIRSWEDLEIATSINATIKFRQLYASVDDIDLFSAGLAEKPLKGGLVGPTFACIIAQQFKNLRKGDRFWFENPHIENSFTLSQLQQIRGITLAQVLCRTMDNVDSVQPFVMLIADNRRNRRRSCFHRTMAGFNLDPWKESQENNFQDMFIPDDEFTNHMGETSNDESISRTKVSAKIGQQRFVVNKKLQNYFNKPTVPPKQQENRAPVRQRPIKTKINQQNRIAVKRPLAPGENVTIFVQNNAVNAPIFINNAHVSGSSIQINQLSSSSPQPDHHESIQKPPSFGVDPATTVCTGCPYSGTNLYPSIQIPKPITKPTTKPTAKPPNDNYKPYLPYNFNDPNNPNPPHYGFNANPANDYIPNNFYFHNMMKYFHRPHHELYDKPPPPPPPPPIGSKFNFNAVALNQPSDFNKNWLQKTELIADGFGSTSSQQDTSNLTLVDSQMNYSAGESGQAQGAIYPEQTTNSKVAELQLPKYRFDTLWNEKKLTIDELIQHTKLPLNPIGVIESARDDDEISDKKESNDTTKEYDNIGQRVALVNEKQQQGANGEERTKIKSILYFDRNILKKYPENIQNSKADAITFRDGTTDFIDSSFGNDRLNETCKDEDDFQGLQGSKINAIEKLKIKELNTDSKLLNSSPILNNSSYDFLTESYPVNEYTIKISSLSDSDLSWEERLEEMPTIQSDETAITSQIPKPMKCNLFL